MANELLIEAEEKALQLFAMIEQRRLIEAGKTENELNKEVFQLANELFGIDKYWHKRIVRAGKNTLLPYNENPPDLTIKEDDILFFDFGPIFEEYEADIGRTYVIGEDPKKLKLKKDVESAWMDIKLFYDAFTENLTGAQLYNMAVSQAKMYGWEFGGEIAGHIIGHFPHEKLEKEDKTNYIHPENNTDLFAPDKSGKARDWILEIHFVDKELQIGGFFEQLLTREIAIENNWDDLSDFSEFPEIEGLEGPESLQDL